MPHPEQEHSLRIQLATALRERNAAKDRAHQLNSVALERGQQIAFERERFSETRKELTALRSERDALRAENERLRAALTAIREWKLPPTDHTWDDGTPMSYGAAFGSNGERDFMRGVARAALASGGDDAGT